jgi:hypothetical protein
VTALHRGYVRTERGSVLVQLPDDTTFGFSLHSDDQSWPGGLGVDSEWEALNESDVSAQDRARLGWLLEAS